MTRACATCGTPAPTPYQAPPPELAPDLDLRPGEPTRSTLPHWIATCRGCGASAPDLAILPARARETLHTPAYQALSGPAPEHPFLRWALLCEAGNDPAEAAEACLQAAWALDDAGADASAPRLRAAALWGTQATLQDSLRALDALRRAAAMEPAALHARLILARPELADTDRAIVAFQQRLIAAGDEGRHLISSALRPPSSTPHVAHGRTRPRGFWARMVGR